MDNLIGKRVLITAGPTHEYIDRVRYIGNCSSGKMGIELAKRAEALGAEVYLVIGPTHIEYHNEHITRIDVVSAEQMFEAVKLLYGRMDVVIASAAVADFKPKHRADQKIKKENGVGIKNIELTETQDILKWMGDNKKDQTLIGFALETENEIENAKGKLERKNLDGIVLNSLQDKGAGFAGDTNKITYITGDSLKEFNLKSKTEVAIDILNQIKWKTK